MCRVMELEVGVFSLLAETLTPAVQPARPWGDNHFLLEGSGGSLIMSLELDTRVKHQQAGLEVVVACGTQEVGGVDTVEGRDVRPVALAVGVGARTTGMVQPIQPHYTRIGVPIYSDRRPQTFQMAICLAMELWLSASALLGRAHTWTHSFVSCASQDRTRAQRGIRCVFIAQLEAMQARLECQPVLPVVLGHTRLRLAPTRHSRAQRARQGHIIQG
jgi:hypothetical protein